MVWPLRTECEGATEHVLSRGNNQQSIFFSQDRYIFLKTLARMSERFEVNFSPSCGWTITATCCREPTG